MKIEDVIIGCKEQLAMHMARGTTAELFKAMYTWPLDDSGSIFENIKRADKHTRETLDKKIDTALMDFAKNPETAAESFMFRLRVESAIVMLSILTNSKISLELKTEIPEEAVVWALNTLWRGSCAQWAYRTAAAFLEGRPSALELRSPA
jgi:hypothetical protein